MSVSFFTIGGQPFPIGGKLALMFRDAAPSVPVPAPGAPMPSLNMGGWWDASALSWQQPYYSLPDKSTAGKSANPGGAFAIPRLAGNLGGLYLEGSPYASPFIFNYLHPLIVDYAVNASNITVGPQGAFTVFLVWSRANQRQPGGVVSTAPVSLVTINNTPVLGMTANGDGNDTLTLFPNGAALPGGKLELRHTHSLCLEFSGTAVDVWLDNVKVITGASLGSFSLGTTAALSFLNAAQCIFHEAATWPRVLSSAEHADLNSYARRWPLGPRRALNGAMFGQSNAAHQVGVSTPMRVSRKVAYLTGCISSNMLVHSGGYGQLSGGATTFSGSGLYDTSGDLILKQTTADPSTWDLGSHGISALAALDSMTPDMKANFRYVAWFWTEADSFLLTPATKVQFTAAIKRAFFLIRQHLNMTAEQLPFLVISALPFDYDIGCQTHREIMADLEADASQNVHIMLAQSGDACGETTYQNYYDPATGLETGPGNRSHRDDEGQVMYSYRMGIPIARAALAANIAAGTPDVVTAIDANIPKVGGPQVLSAVKESSTSVLVTVKHDGGTDLSLPLRAVLGVGWTLNGTAISATACAKVDATHLRLTFPNVPAGALLYYGYGSNLDANSHAVIGRGNAVIDNFASVTLPAGWSLKNDMGVAEQPNYPLQATPYGISIT